jgi:hypothetical protein
MVQATRPQVTSLRTIIERRRQDLAEAAPDLEVVFHWGEPHEFPQARDFAYCFYTPGVAHVVLAPKTRHQHAARQDGLICHELGHGFLLHNKTQHNERMCDATAERLFGCHIYYDAEDVQTTAPEDPGARRPRPAHLPTGNGEPQPRRNITTAPRIREMERKKHEEQPLSNPIGRKFGGGVVVVRMPHGERRHIKHPGENSGTLCCPRTDTEKRSYRVVPVVDQNVAVDCYRCLRLAAYNQEARNSPIAVPPPSDRDLYTSLSRKKRLVSDTGEVLTNRRKKT